MTFTCIYCESLLAELSGAMRGLGDVDSKLAFAVRSPEGAANGALIFEVSVARQQFKRARTRLEHHVLDRHRKLRHNNPPKSPKSLSRTAVRRSV